MSCKRYEAYEAGKTAPEEFAEHARRCPSCADQAALDARLDKELTPMREPVQVSGLWEGIEAALVQEMAAAGERKAVLSVGRRPFAVFAGRPRPMFIAAAAAALALLILGGAYVLTRRPVSSPGILAQRALARVEAKEKEHADAIDALERQARPRIQGMDLQMMSLYRDKLAAIDAQIERCREALATNPANAHIRQYLLAALQDKRQTLSDVLGTVN